MVACVRFMLEVNVSYTLEEQDGDFRIFKSGVLLETHIGATFPSLPIGLAKLLMDDLVAADPDSTNPRLSLCYCMASTMIALELDHRSHQDFAKEKQDRIRTFIQWDRAFRLQPGPAMAVEMRAVQPLVEHLAAEPAPEAAWEDRPLNYASNLDEIDDFGRVNQASVEALLRLAEHWSAARLFSVDLVCCQNDGQSPSLILLWCAHKISTNELAFGLWCFAEDGACFQKEFNRNNAVTSRIIAGLERMSLFIDAWDEHYGGVVPVGNRPDD